MPSPEEPAQGPERQENDAADMYSTEGSTLPGRAFDMRKLAEQLMMLDEKSPITLNAMAAEFCEQGNFTAAEFCSRAAVRFMANQIQSPEICGHAFLGMAKALNGQHRYDEALEWAYKAYEFADSVPLKLMSSASAALALGDTFAAMGRATEAQQWYNRHRQLMIRALFQNG